MERGKKYFLGNGKASRKRGVGMERLTDKNADGNYFYPKCFEKCDGLGASRKCDNCEITTSICEKLGKYEDLEEQGRLIRIPCKVGDTVYGMSMGKIIRLTVNEISIFCMKGERVINVKCQNNDEFRNYVEREFGKTVFLTKSEAEAKLEELRGGENESSN